MDRTERRILVGCIVSIVLALGLVVAYLGPHVLLEITPLDVGKFLLTVAVAVAISVPLNWMKHGFPWPGRTQRDLAAALGLEAKRKGELRGMWNGRRVLVRLAPDSPAVVVGDEPGAKGVLWDATERRLEELLVPRKDPAPALTGDRAFDDRFVWRPGTPTTLAASVRKAMLAGGTGNPDQVAVGAAGLGYWFQDDEGSATRIRAALDGAVALADALGLPRDG